jgi:hypothetical protein
MPGLVGTEVCTEAATVIRTRVQRTLRMMKVSPGKHFKAMLDADWMHSPDGWSGLPFGSIGSRGWQKGPGTGRIGALPEISIFSLKDSETSHHIH